MKRFLAIAIFILSLWGSASGFSDIKGRIVLLPKDPAVRALTFYKSSAVPSYRYSMDLGEISPEYAGYTVRWNPQTTVNVYVNYDASDAFIEILKRAIKIWNSVISAKLVYAGKRDTKSVAEKFINRDTNVEEAIYVVEDSSHEYLSRICGDEDNLAGCSAPLYLCMSDKATSCHIAYNIMVVENYESGGTLKDWSIKKEAYFLHYLLHELGHSLGLGHPFEYSGELYTPSVMSYSQYKATLYPSLDDIDVIEHLYGEKTDRGEPIFITTYYTPSFPPEFKVKDSMWWQDLYGEVFCINGGVYPYEVTGATLVERDGNAFCYKYENGAHITIKSRDGQVVSTVLNRANIVPGLNPYIPVSLGKGYCRENNEAFVPYSYRIALVPEIEIPAEDLKKYLFFYWAVTDEKGRVLLVEKLGETPPNSLGGTLIKYYIIPDYLYVNGLSGCFYIYIGYFTDRDDLSSLENLRCGYWKVCFEGYPP